MRVLLCGVRGSMPASGIDFHRVGGHTSCLAIEAPGDRMLVLDAGTGFTRLATELGGRALRGSILLTHLHWDHWQGLPFLPNADRDDAEVSLLLPRQGDASALEVLARSMSPPHFPIGPTGLRGSWSVGSLDDGTHLIEGFEVTAADVAHKGGRTFGYRVSNGQATMAYLPDHAPNIAGAVELEAAEGLVEGVDVLFHGGQFLASERERADAYGHATVDDAVGLAARAGVGRLVLIHHAPTRTDQEVDAMAAALADTDVEVVVGCEGDRMVISCA
jgi:ribonuclease BN (tRNA processing enzyme)